jgi:pyruvate formate lyase activating enzyme
VSPDLPWHLTAFHPDYKMTEPRRTTVEDLLQAAEIGVAEGLRYVYAGNLPGRVGRWEDTRCPHCAATLVERQGFIVRRCRLAAAARCPQCQHPVPGLWALP